MAINMNYGVWVKVARTFAASQSLTLKWASEAEIEQQGAQAWTDGRAIYTRKPSAKWDEKQFKLWLYYLFHEVGHNTEERRKVFDVLKDKRPSGLLAYVYNLCEDNVQEHCLQEDELSLRRWLSEGRAAFYDFILARKTKPNPDRKAPALFSWDAGVRTEFQEPVVGYESRLRARFPEPEVQEWVDRLNAGGYAAELLAKPDVWETFEIAERIVRDVFDEKPEEQQQGNEPQQSQGEGQPGEGQGEGQGQGKGEAGEGQGQGEPGQGEPGEGKGQGSGQPGGKGEDGKGKPGTAAKVDYTDWLVGHNHAADARSGNQPDQPSAGLFIDYEKYFEENIGYAEFVPNIEGMKVYLPGLYPFDRSGSNGDPPPSTLSTRVARYMQAKSKDRRIYGQKSGKLAGRSLYKLKMTGIGEARKRVFNQRVVNKSKDVAVTVAIDMSGSMGTQWDSPKKNAALASAVHLHEVLCQKLHIPLEIVGFSEVVDQNRYVGCAVVIQEFGKQVSTEKVTARLQQSMCFQGANRDGETILWLRDRLLAQRAARHIMIVISDGQPRTQLRTDVAEFTGDVIKQVEREGLVDLYAIGLMTDNVKYFYKQYQIINSPDELESALLTVLKDKIIDEVIA